MESAFSNRYSQAKGTAERDRCGAVPLALPSDGFPRAEAFSQLVHIKGLRAQRDLYPRASFNAALEAAALNGLECYRFRTLRTFIDHVPVALVPRGSNVVLAHIPAVLSQAADAVMALGHRLYFEVEGPLRGIGDEEDGDDNEPGFAHPPRRNGHQSTSGGSCGSSSSNNNSQRALTPAGLARTRSGSIVGGLNTGGSVSFSGGKLAAWMPSVGGSNTADGGGCGNGNGTGNTNGNDALLLPPRRGSLGTASTCTTASTSVSSALQSPLQSFSSIKSSASSSFRALRGVLTARHSSSRALLYSAPEIELADPRVCDPRFSEDDDDHVSLMNGGRYSLDKLAVAISIFADGEEAVQAFRQELGLRGIRVGEELPCRPPVRLCR